ncbi:hypothetical protein FGO68_gene17205 [Halteria grandinella]|uniref:Protein kinase domain-containing protein n=1 Tax=Halteria grandinella TaxID=5974 RepID=A0A8J8P825_HALGN|nr:hypothetical protein FGO68_gene17205 [Halteria grandinella]
MRNNVDAQAQFIVSTNTWKLKQTKNSAHNLKAGLGENYEWSGEPRLMTCILCNDFIFFFLNNNTAALGNQGVVLGGVSSNNNGLYGLNSDAFSSKYVGDSLRGEGSNAFNKQRVAASGGRLNKNSFCIPNFFSNIEFASIRILQNASLNLKIGFTLRLGPVIHQFIVVNPSQFRKSKNVVTTLEDSQKSDLDPFVPQISKIQNQQNIQPHQYSHCTQPQPAIIYTSNNAKVPDISIGDLHSNPEQNEAQVASKEIRAIMKEWIQALNMCVIRSEEPNKYSLMEQIGAGAQAKVYKIVRRKISVGTKQPHTQNLNTSFNPDAFSCSSLNNYHPNDPEGASRQIDGAPNIGQARIVEGSQGVTFQEDDKWRQAVKASPERITISQYPGLKNNANHHQANPKSKPLAMKVICKKQLAKKALIDKGQMINEIQIQRQLRLCGNIIRLNKIYECDKYLNLLMDFQEGGTLGDILEKQIRISEEDARIITAQILLTVDFMSRKGVIHRDLKPENILLSSKQDGVYEIKIADFGFAIPVYSAHSYNEKLLTAVCGTPGYIAPEALVGNGFNLKSDVFSVGSILYSILTLRNLFNGASYQEIMELNKMCNLSHLDRDTQFCSNEARDLMKKLLNKDMSKRPTAIQALSHPWFINEKLPLENSMQINKVITSPNFNPNQAFTEDSDVVQTRFGLTVHHPSAKNLKSCENGAVIDNSFQLNGMDIPIAEQKLQTLKETLQNRIEAPVIRPARFQAKQHSNPREEEKIAGRNIGGRVSLCLRQPPLQTKENLGSGVIHRTPSDNMSRSNSQVNYYQIISEYKHLQKSGLNRSMSPMPQFSGQIVQNFKNASTANQPNNNHVIIRGSQMLQNSSKNGFSVAATQKDQGASIHRVEENMGCGSQFENHKNILTTRNNLVAANNHSEQAPQLEVERFNINFNGPQELSPFNIPLYGQSRKQFTQLPPFLREESKLNVQSPNSSTNQYGMLQFQQTGQQQSNMRRDFPSPGYQQDQTAFIADTCQVIIDQNMTTLNNQLIGQGSNGMHPVIERDKTTRTVKALPGLDLIQEQPPNQVRNQGDTPNYQLPQFGNVIEYSREEVKRAEGAQQQEPNQYRDNQNYQSTEKDPNQQQQIKEQFSRDPTNSANEKLNSRLQHLAQAEYLNIKDDIEGGSSGSVGIEESEHVNSGQSDDQRQCFMFLVQNVTREISHITAPLKKEQTRKLIIHEELYEELQDIPEHNLIINTEKHVSDVLLSTQKQDGPTMKQTRKKPPPQTEQREVFISNHHDFLLGQAESDSSGNEGEGQQQIEINPKIDYMLNCKDIDHSHLKISQGMSVFACPDETEDDLLSPDKRWAHLKMKESKQHQRAQEMGLGQQVVVKEVVGENEKHRQGVVDVQVNSYDNTQNNNQPIDMKRFMQGLNVAKNKRVFL